MFMKVSIIRYFYTLKLTIKDDIQEVIKAIALFDGVKIFYNEKFLLDASENIGINIDKAQYNIICQITKLYSKN